jgi:DNA-binding CsgD family transcriptional regulator
MVSCMGVLTNADHRDILNLAYLANCCEGLESFEDILSVHLSKIFHSECTTFHVIEKCDSPRLVKMAETRSFYFDGNSLKEEDKLYPKLYNDYYYKHSPLLAKALSSSKTVFKTGSSISFQNWEMTEIYNYFIRPQNIYRELFLALRWKGNLIGMITLWRSRKQPDYSKRDVLKAEMLAPHLAVAIHNIGMFSKIHHGKESFISTDTPDTEGLLLLDQKFKPIYLNAKAKEICQHLSGAAANGASNLEGEEFPVPSCIIDNCSELLHSLKAVDEPVPLPKGRVFITENGAKFRIECSLVWKANYTNSVPNFMVAMYNLTNGRYAETITKAKQRLSKRELEIINCIIAGMSYSEIADKLYISKLTVHTHVKNIYRKIRAKSRIELERLIQGSI